MGDLAQQIYLGQLAQQQGGGMPMRGMMPQQQAPQMPMQPPGNPYDMNAINQVRQSMGVGPGHKPITPGFLDMLGAIGGYMGTRSKDQDFAHHSRQHLANFGVTARAKEQERLALNRDIMESLRHAAKDQEDRAYRNATLGETVRGHNLTREEHDLMRAFRKEENEAKRLGQEEDRAERKRHNDMLTEDKKLRREEMGTQNAHLNKTEINNAKESLKIGNEAELGLKSVNKMIDFFEKSPLTGRRPWQLTDRQTLDALRKDVLLHEIKKLPAKGQNRELQRQIDKAIPGFRTTRKSALETLSMKKAELEEQIAAKKEAQELIASFKTGKKDHIVKLMDKNGKEVEMVNPTPEDLEAALNSKKYTRAP